MVNFALKTALSDEDQKDIAVTGLDPGYSYFLLSLRAVVQVVSSSSSSGQWTCGTRSSYHFP